MIATNVVFKKIPVGLIDYCINIVQLAGNIINILYRPECDNAWSPSSATLDPDCEIATVYITFEIDEELELSFREFLVTDVENKCSMYNKVEETTEKELAKND